MGKPSSRNRIICMVMYSVVCMLLLIGLVMHYEGWINTLGFLALFGLIGYSVKAYQLYYCRTIIQILRVLASIFCAWIILIRVLNHPIGTLGGSCILLVATTLLIRGIISRVIVPASSVIVFDTEQNAQRARMLSQENNNSMRVMGEFKLPKNEQEKKELIEYINTFHVQQLCLFVEDELEAEPLLEICSEKEMAVVLGTSVSNNVKKKYALSRMDYFNHVYFSTGIL